MKQTKLKSIITTILLLFTVLSYAQVKDFEKYSNEKNVTYVYISKAMLGFMGKSATPKVQGVNVRDIMEKLSAIQIITSENKTSCNNIKEDVQKIVKRDKFDLLMQVDDDGQKVRIYSHIGKAQSVIIMTTTLSDETSLIIFSGKFETKDLDGLIKK